MLHDPQLLILGEPTDGVDPVGRSEMRVILQRLKSAGKTIFINSHLLQEVELVCDRVAILDHGQVLHQGSIAELTQARLSGDVKLVVAGSEAVLLGTLADLPPLGMRSLGDEQFELSIPGADQALVDRAVDCLRGQGLSIVAIARKAQTLEEAFLNILGQARGK
jgi:ABC-2 type transport system ATP-binding protein